MRLIDADEIRIKPEYMHDICGVVMIRVEDIARILNDMPTIEPEPHWIPCSERLPEVGTYVLISKKALNFRSNLPNVCTAHRSCDPRGGKEEWNDMLFGKLDDGDVLAWMPLPEGYRGGQDE